MWMSKTIFAQRDAGDWTGEWYAEFECEWLVRVHACRWHDRNADVRLQDQRRVQLQSERDGHDQRCEFDANLDRRSGVHTVRSGSDDQPDDSAAK